MGQIFLPDNLPLLVKDSGTVVSLAATYLGQPTRVIVGGQQYKLTAALTCNTATAGAGGLDTGSLAADTLYYVYAVFSGSSAALVASTAAPSVGPTGFTAWKEVGRFRTSGAATVSYVTTTELGLETSWFQKKKLTADVTSDGPMADLTFNVLVPGKIYRATLQARFDITSDNSVTAAITHDGLILALAAILDNDTANNQRQGYSVSAVFRASTSLLTFDAGSASATGIISGNDTFTETWAMLEELGGYQAI